MGHLGHLGYRNPHAKYKPNLSNGLDKYKISKTLTQNLNTNAKSRMDRRTDGRNDIGRPLYTPIHPYNCHTAWKDKAIELCLWYSEDLQDLETTCKYCKASMIVHSQPSCFYVVLHPLRKKKLKYFQAY